MKVKTVRKVLVAMITLVSLGLMLGCAGMEYAPANRRPGYMYYPNVLVAADKALDEARQKGKDKECPSEFNEAKARVDKAYEEYMGCKTPGQIPINIECSPGCDVKADKDKITFGDSVTLTMTTSGNVTAAVVEGTEWSPADKMKKITPPLRTTQLTVKVSGPSGSNTCSVPITVIPPPAPTCDLKSDKQEIKKGDSVTLTMTTSGMVTSAAVDGTDVAMTGGTKEVRPASATTFTAKVEGPGGPGSCSVPVTVMIPPPPAPPAPTCELKADKEKITLGESVILTMTTSGNVTSAVLDGTEVALTGGTKKIAPNAATQFTAKVEGPGGPGTCSVSVAIHLILYIHFPFDRPKKGEGKWFINPDADNSKDSRDPENRKKSKSPFVNTLLKDNPAELKKAVEFVKNNTGTNITVIGHTDSLERKPGYNQLLSERRANAVKEYLIDQQVIGRDMIAAKGLAATDPIASEKTSSGKDDPEGRAKNRRVEIVSDAIPSR